MILNDNMRVNPNPGFILRGSGGADEETFEYDEKGRLLHRKNVVQEQISIGWVYIKQRIFAKIRCCLIQDVQT